MFCLPQIKKTMPEKKIKNTNSGSGKIKRKKFFLYTGSALLGILALKNIPSSILSSFSTKKSSLKITENPNAVKRKSRQTNNG